MLIDVCLFLAFVVVVASVTLKYFDNSKESFLLQMTKD